MAQKNIEALVEEAINSLIEQFPSAKDSYFIKDYEISGKIQALKDLLKKELLSASEDKGLVALISKSGTIWSNLYYILNDIGIDYKKLQIKNEIVIDFSVAGK